MSKTQYNVRAREFDTYKDALAEVKEGQVLLANISKLSTALFASQLTEFATREYTRKEMTKILDDKDVETFRSICPLYFRTMNMKMTSEQEDFFSKNVTVAQLCYLPIPVFKVFSPESLTRMIDLVELTDKICNKKHKHHAVYELYSQAQHENCDYIFYVVKEANVADVLHSQRSYVIENEDHNRLDRDFRDFFEQDSMTLTELADYLHVHPQYLKKVYFDSEPNSFNKYLKPYEKGQAPGNILESRVTTKSVLDLLKATYTGKKSKGKDFVYEHGLLDWKSLTRLANMEDSITHATLFHNFRQKHLAGFKLSDRVVRFAEDDFEQYCRNRPQRNAYARSLLQLPAGMSEEEKSEVLSDYIEERVLYDRLSCSVKSVEEIENYRCLPMVKFLRSNLTLYTVRGIRHSYFRKKDINELVSRLYGYQKDGEFVGGKEFDLDLIGDLLRIEPLMRALTRRYAEHDYSTIYATLNKKTENGTIPFVNAGQRRHLFVWEDVIKGLDGDLFGD